MAVDKGERRTSSRGTPALLSERLLVVLTREMDSLEAASKDIVPISGVGEGLQSGGLVSAAAKGRIEAVGQMTRTLEKLLDLKRLEALAARGDGDEDGEAARLRDELLARLRALDARRRDGARLFGPDGSAAEEGGGAPAGLADSAGGAAVLASGAGRADGG